MPKLQVVGFGKANLWAGDRIVLLASPIIGFVVTLFLLYLYLKLSHQYKWFDQPNEERKLHNTAIPTSAGIFFMLPIVLMAVFLPNISLFSSYYFIGSIVLLIIVGAYDDFKHLSVSMRFIIVSFAAVALIAELFNIQQLNYFLILLYFLGVIWWMNLFNFMDGADGMTVLHALVAVVGYFLYFWFFSDLMFLHLIYFLFVFACLFAFLLFNFPRAKMFMGDSGSLSLSFLIAAIALYGISSGVFNEVTVITFHLVFIVDATLTLFTRLRYKHALTQAHNLHLFQALIASGKSHVSVSLSYALATVVVISITLLLKYLDVSQVVMLLVLVIESLVFGFYWYKFHNKTKFERFIR